MSRQTQDFSAGDFAEPLPSGVTLIEASAGTGKTHTVAALFLRLVLEQNFEIDQILVTTFTIAATAELRDRIRKLLHEAREALAARASDDAFLAALVERFRPEAAAMRERLTRALHAFDESAIHTIHGFCQRILQDRAFESGSPFDQEFVTDEKRLFREVAEDYWRQRTYACETCLAAAAITQKLTPEAFARLLGRRLNHPLAVLIPELPEKNFRTIERELVAQLARLREGWRKECETISAIFLDDASWAKADYAKPEIMGAHLAAIASCFDEESTLTGFQSFEPLARSRISEGVRKGKSAPQHEFFEQCESLLDLTQQYARALEQDFLRWAVPELEQRKLRQNIQSSSDLLTRLHAGLVAESGEALAAAIRRRFRAALIDEFQDTDPLQEEIFHRIFGHADCWLFLIGDPKQAIYGFRGADVFAYLDASARAQRRFTLGTNYRSATKLVAGVNHLFGCSTAPFVIEDIAFLPMEAHGRPDAEAFSGDSVAAPLRIWAWPGKIGDAVITARQSLFAPVAAEIARLLQGSARLGTRAVVPSDITVLTLLNVEAQQMQAALAKLGVPAALLSNARVFDSPDALELLAVLSAVARPRDEARLRAALFTDLLGCTANEIHALSSDEGGWEQRLLQFADWHDAWTRTGFIQMFRRLLLDAGVRARLLSRLGGERRLTNLLHLSELLQQAAAENRFTPSGVVKWFAEQITNPSKEASDDEEIRLERDEDAVRIVTVYKSKGLQYNIVFCPFLWEARDEPRHFRFHDPKNDRRLTLDLGSPEEEAHREIAHDEQLAEQARLVYVALTRARQRCDFIWGAFKGGERSALAWLFHPPSAAQPHPAAALADRFKSLSPEQMRMDLAAIAESSRGSIAVVEMPDENAPFYRPPEAGAGALRAREFRAVIEREWSVSSFSSLTERHDADAPDYDPRTPEPPIVAAVEPKGIHAFPAGTRAGLCLHSILQRLDFTKRAGLDSLAQKALTDFAFDTGAWTVPVAECLQRTLETKLAPGFSLSDVPPSACLTELEFHLPAQRLEAESLRALLGTGDPHRIEFSPRRGWLKGYIDLVFEHGGRFYIADWKSNRLGSHGGAYTQAALASAMGIHHYRLQFHLYATALHRYLALRLPNYEYERHFGGVFYLFLRGMDPGHPELGVFHERPAFETVAGFDQWLSGTSKKPVS